MAFSKKRGRPRLNKTKNDYGTKELREKIARNFTAEPLDLCLKKNLITKEEHQAGIRLRWLYTLRFGAPGISAYTPESRGPACFRNDDEKWLAARRNEYNKMLCALEKTGSKRIVMNICIFNQHACFLKPVEQDISPYEFRIRYSQHKKFKEGMECLVNFKN